MENSYYRVRISGITTINEDILTSIVFEHGATGLSEALHFEQPNLMYEPKVTYARTHDLDVFFPEKPAEDFIQAIKKLDPKILYEVFQEQSKDWLEEWKKGFKPFQLVGPYWIVPSWEKIPGACEKPIFIDPGMAFGTGTHATTQMAAYFAHKISVQQVELLPAMSFLDVGTGTAILAMLAKQAGFGSVVGIEIDPDARRVARENLKLNKLEEVEIKDVPIDELRSSFDVVIANIIDGVLVQIREDLLRVLNSGGHLFLTGILLERENYFYENFIEKSDVKVVRRLEKDEWVGYWLQKT